MRMTHWLMQLLFPLTLAAVILASLYFQPPLISSPEISRKFTDQGSRPGFIEAGQSRRLAWPPGLPRALKQALIAAFGPDWPAAESIYYFGLARSPVWGLPLKSGAETILIPNRGRAVGQRIVLFGFQIRLAQAGWAGPKAWRRINGRPLEADFEAARKGDWLERAALLLPLAAADLAWRKSGPDGLRASVSPGGELSLAFSHDRLVEARLSEQKIILSQFQSFGPFVLPTQWSGRWGQLQMSRFQLQGLVLNPPFAQAALAANSEL